MLTDHLVDEQSLDRLRHGAAGVYLDDFTDWLADSGYADATIRSYIFAADRFLTWARSAGQAVPALDLHSLSSYRAHLTAAGPGGRREGGNAYCGARRLVIFLRQRGLVADVRPAEPPLLTAFGAWMRQHRGVTETTITGYSRVLRQLLEALGSKPGSYTATQLRAFVLAQSRGYSHSKAETVVTAVRMFVRYLIATEQCGDALQYAIPRLALRAGDVAALCLDDIDWPHGRLRVSGKTHQEAWLPVPQEVGDAILHYLGTARPAVAQDAVFLITHAPYTPILPRQVSQTAERAIRRAGIDAPGYGAHLFRHSAATALVRQGLSLQAIGSLLRHRDVDTTAVYAKVDVDLLRQVALPWPEEDLPC